MILYLKSILFFIGIFLSLESPLTADKSYLAKEADDHQHGSQSPWATSLNVRFGDLLAIDSVGNLHSNRLSEWHVSQGPTLADIYNNYQPTARNVAKCLFSIIYNYADRPTELKIKHLPLKHVFINGWDVSDSEIIKDTQKLKNKLHFHKNDYPDFINPATFLSLNQVINGDANLIDKLLQIDLLPIYSQNNVDGFKDAKELLEETGKHASTDQRRLPSYIKALREQETHSEKVILIYIYKNIIDIINGLDLPKDCNVMQVLINIASYRDMCPKCQEIGQAQKPLSDFIKTIQQLINGQIKQANNIIVKVICSGVSHIRGQDRPIYNNSYSPIDISGNQMLYMVQNPIYTYALDGNVNSKQYLTTMKNYLPYQGGSW